LLLYKDSLNVSDAGIVYDKSAEIVFSSVGPILSLMIEIPKPKLLLFRGVYRCCVRHWRAVKSNPLRSMQCKILITPLDPA
jgi:hypothetical protein